MRPDAGTPRARVERVRRAAGVNPAGGSSVLRGIPRWLPLGSCRLEACLATGLEDDHLRRALRAHRPRRHEADDVQVTMHHRTSSRVTGSCGGEAAAFRDLRRRRRGSSGGQGRARPGSNQHPLVCETSALPLSYSPGLGRGSCGPEGDAFRDLPRRRRGSSGGIPLGGIPLANKFRDKGSNLDLHVQSVVSCRLDDPGKVGVSIHVPEQGRRCSGRPVPCRSRPVSRSTKPNDVVQATRLPFDPGSPAAGCAIRDGRRPTWRSFGARASRTCRKWAGKSRS